MTTNTVTRLEHDNIYSNKIGTRRLRPDFQNLGKRLKKLELTEHDCNTTATCFITTRQSCHSRVQKSRMWECGFRNRVCGSPA